MNGSPLVFVLAMSLGTLGIWRLLPRARARRPIVDAAPALAALTLLAFAAEGEPRGHWALDAVFHAFALGAVVAAVGTLVARDAVRSMTSFGVCSLGVAGLLFVQGQPLVAVVVWTACAVVALTAFFVARTTAQPNGSSSPARGDHNCREPLSSSILGAALACVVYTAMTTDGSPPGVGPSRNLLLVSVLLLGLGLIGFLARRDVVLRIVCLTMTAMGAAIGVIAWSSAVAGSAGPTLAMGIAVVSACHAGLALAWVRIEFQKASGRK